MEIERAIEILDPEHREQYDSLATVQEACRMGMAALEKQNPVQSIQRESVSMLFWCCGSCGVAITEGDRFCRMCGRKVKWDG